MGQIELLLSWFIYFKDHSPSTFDVDTFRHSFHVSLYAWLSCATFMLIFNTQFFLGTFLKFFFTVVVFYMKFYCKRPKKKYNG